MTERGLEDVREKVREERGQIRSGGMISRAERERERGREKGI